MPARAKPIRFSLATLAVRNVRRQMRNYIIYFVTVAVTVALMFSIDNVLFSDVMLARLTDIHSMQAGLGLVTALIALVVSFVIGYAGAYMLRCRKREFGTYMTLGLDRGDILKLFWCETAVISLLSLGVGIVLGLGVYQMIMLFVRRLLELGTGLSGYSWRALVLTVGLVLGMFFVSSLSSALYLKRVKIYSLLHAERYGKGTTKHPVLWGVFALAMLAVLVVCVILFRTSILRVYQGNDAAQFEVILLLVGAIVSVFGLTVAAAKSLAALLLKCKRLARRKTNTFILRQLTSKMGTNAVLFGVLAVLISCAVLASDFAFAMKAHEEMFIERDYPFAASAFWERGQIEWTDERVERIFAEYTDVAEKYVVPLYDTGEQTLLRQSTYGKYFDDSDDNEETDRLLRLSDYNRLLRALGKPEVTLDDGYLLLDLNGNAVANRLRFENFDYTVGGMTLPCRGVWPEDVGIGSAAYDFLVAVIPDAAVEGLTPTHDFYAWKFTSEAFDGTAMAERFLDTVQTEQGWDLQFRAVHVRRYMRERNTANSAVWIVAALYIAVVFVFMSMAILALKALSDVDVNRIRYDVLRRVGLDQTGRNVTLLCEIGVFFLLPFLLPFFMSIPIVLYAGWMLTLSGFSASVVYATGAALDGILVLVTLFFAVAAFAVARKNTL